MQHAELATLLVEAGDAERQALLRSHAALIDPRLAYLLKDICLDGWASDPARALRAAEALKLVSETYQDAEIAALSGWTSGLEALIKGQMNDAIANLENARQQFLLIDKPHVAASTEVSKVIGLAMLGRYDEAIAAGVRARAVFLDYGDLLAAGKIEHNLGNICFRRDRYREAEEFHSSARARFSELNDRKQLATINNCLANTHALLHQFQSAEDLYQQAVEQAESAHLPVTLAEIEGNIGNFALMRGRYDRALDYLERSRRRYASLGMAHQSAIAEQEIADAYLELNLGPEASEIYQRVTETFESLGMRAEEARALAYHGRASILMGKPGEALGLLTRAQQLYRAEENEVGEALAILAQAHLQYGQQNYELARGLVTQVEPVLLQSGSWQRLLLARWLQGEIERMLGHNQDARSMIESTLIEATSKELPHLVQRCHTTLGLLATAENDFDKAEYHFREAIALIEEMRAPLPGEEFRTSFFANKLVPYVELVRLVLAGGPGRHAEALNVVESARSRALADRLAVNKQPGAETRDEFELELLRRQESLGEELNYIYNQLDRGFRGGSGGDRDARRKEQFAELQQALRDREHKMLEISRQLQHRAREDSRDWGVAGSLNLALLQQQLGKDSALVEYTTIDDELLAFVITDEGVESVRHLAGFAVVAAEIKQFRFQIDTLRYGSAAVRKHLPVLTERMRKHLASLHDKLLRKIEGRIGGRRRIIIVPERDLHYLPFHALHDGESYLIERREVSYAPSATVLQQCLNQESKRRSTLTRSFQNALLVGVADDQIPRVRDEITAIELVFREARVLLDEGATVEALRENLPGADVVHLACHAHFRSDNPLFSSMRLSGGWLTVRDAYELPLECNLVTLSACETGVNAIAPGDELIGLARGFFSAGSPTVLLSLWTVDDEATAELMVRFYGELTRSNSPSEALRSAQLEVIRNQPHPFFWSPFILTGRW